MADLACNFDRSRLGRWHAPQASPPGSRQPSETRSQQTGRSPREPAEYSGPRGPQLGVTPSRQPRSLSPDEATAALAQLRLHSQEMQRSDDRRSRGISSDEKAWGLSEAEGEDRSPSEHEISTDLLPVAGQETLLRHARPSASSSGVNHPGNEGFGGGRCIFGDDEGLPPLAQPFEAPSPIQPEEDDFDPAQDQTLSDELSTARYYMNFSNHREIGEGDFGTVCRVQDDEDHRTYCIKRAKKASLGSDLQGRLQEVYALSVCRSPFILRYYDAWIEHDMVHIKTELARGGPISRQPVPWSETALWDFLLQTALGLHSMHSCNVAHMDIKPDNIFVDNDEVTNRPIYKIGDFGLARPIQTHSPVGEHFTGLNDEEGDFRYLPPEFSNSGRVQNVVEADVYSLGATVVQLLGGNPKLLKTASASLAALPCSRALAAVLTAMVDLDHTRRPSAFELILTALQHIQQERLESGEAMLVDSTFSEQLESAREELAALHQEARQLQSRVEACGWPGPTPAPSSGFFSSVNNSLVQPEYSDPDNAPSPVSSITRPPLGPSSSSKSLDSMAMPTRPG